jgi:tetratricopeptide (TPR) repeat protein
MGRRTRTLATILVGFVIGGCAGAPVPSGPVISPTGLVYEPGVPPRQTQYSQTASLYLAQGRPEQALSQLRAGIEADAENPIHYFLAGSALAELEELDEADRMWRTAEELYPAYELEIEPARERAWAQAFNRGADLYLEGDVLGAMHAWEAGALIYDLRPEVHRNLAAILGEIGEPEEAIDVYRRGIAGLDRVPATRILEEAEVAERQEARVYMQENLAQLLLFNDRFAEAEVILRERLADQPESSELRASLAAALVGQGRDGEANEIYGELLVAPDLEATELFQIGTSLFRTADYLGAAEAFARVAELQPNGRDAWFNYANALLAAGEWEALIPVGERLVELDPLNENAGLITARAHVEAGDEQAALAALQRTEASPIHLEDLQLLRSSGEASVRGRVLSNEAVPGEPFVLRFVFYGEEGQLGSELLTVIVPEPGPGTEFTVSFGGPASSYRYEPVP